MTFLAVLIVFVVVQWLGAGALFHHDQWYFRLTRWLAAQSALSRVEGLVFCISLVVPLLVVFTLLLLANRLWSGLEIVVAVPVLLFALGRDEFRSVVGEYIAACEIRDWQQAAVVAARLNCDVSEVVEEDWPALSHKVLYAASYRGFERLFAALFWFIALGALGAFMYRLSVLYTRNMADDLPDQALTRRWLWLIEWPAARVLGISFAVTGNFVGCLQSWRHHFWHGQMATAEVLGQCVEGALQMEKGQPQSLEVSEKELRWMQSLYYRTLIFWMCLLAVLAIAF